MTMQQLRGDIAMLETEGLRPLQGPFARTGGRCSDPSPHDEFQPS